MKQEITHVSMTGSQYSTERASNTFVFRGEGDSQQVNSYHTAGRDSLNRLILLHKWWFGMLSFEEKLFLQSLFQVSK